MRIFTLFLFASCLLPFMVACKHPQKLDTAKDAKTKDSVLIEMTRHACFGKCPEYTITIYNSGTAIYEGRRNVEKIGKHKKKFTTTEIQILQTAFNKRFFSFNDEYPVTMTDVPSTQLNYHVNEKVKKVKDNWNGPRELKELQDLVEGYANSENWITIDQ